MQFRSRRRRLPTPGGETMFGQIPDFTNGFEFLRKMWGSAAGMPGGLMPGLQAMTPPMNLEDVDKRIHDLKAVEGWLQLNTNLLRTTIQGLEVQRATLVALQTIGTALSPEAMESAMENVARAANSPSAAPYQQPAEPPAARRVWPEPTVEENEDEEDNGPDAPEAGQAQEPAAASGHTAGHAAGTGDAPPPDDQPVVGCAAAAVQPDRQQRRHRQHVAVWKSRQPGRLWHAWHARHGRARSGARARSRRQAGRQGACQQGQAGPQACQQGSRHQGRGQAGRQTRAQGHAPGQQEIRGGQARRAARQHQRLGRYFRRAVLSLSRT